MEYGHRTNDPDVTFTDDDLDRLIGVLLNKGFSNEVAEKLFIFKQEMKVK